MKTSLCDLRKLEMRGMIHWDICFVVLVQYVRKAKDRSERSVLFCAKNVLIEGIGGVSQNEKESENQMADA